MPKDTDIIALRQPGSVDDPLTESAGDGPRRMRAAALRAEADAFVAQHAGEIPPVGRQRVVRQGYGPERSIQTGIGALDLRRPQVRDRAAAPDAEKICVSSGILPRWARRSRSLDALLPVLYLRGISTGDFQDALAALLGAEAPNLSPGAISRPGGMSTSGPPLGSMLQMRLSGSGPDRERVRHRPAQDGAHRGALSQKTAKRVVFKPVQAAAKTWRRLTGANQLPLVIEGVTFTDGVAAKDTANRAA